MAIPVHERLKAVRTALKLTQRDFIKEIYIAQSVYARMESGKIPVNDRIIELICFKYGVEREYLRGGTTGKIFSDIPPDEKLEHLYSIFTELNKQHQDFLIVQAKELLKMQNQQEEQGQPSAPKKRK